jgi:hypothetical protein
MAQHELVFFIHPRIAFGILSQPLAISATIAYGKARAHDLSSLTIEQQQEQGVPQEIERRLGGKGKRRRHMGKSRTLVVGKERDLEACKMSQQCLEEIRRVVAENPESAKVKEISGCSPLSYTRQRYSSSDSIECLVHAWPDSGKEKG